MPRRFWFLVLPFLLVGCASLPLGRSRIVVQWTTGSEFNTAGFNLYRSDAAAGPFIKINSQLIPASTDPVSGGKYEFEDTNVESGKTYYYELEDVEYGGVTARHGPIIATASTAFDWQVGLAVVFVVLVAFVLLLIRLRPRSSKK